MSSVDRINGLTGDLAIKTPVRVATTANITLSGLQTIDGVSLAAGDRVLVKNQTDAVDNGIWTASTSSWSRALDFDGSYDCVQGTLVSVTSGTVNEQTVWQLTTISPVIGTSSLTFERGAFSDAANMAADDGASGSLWGTVQGFIEYLLASAGSSVIGYIQAGIGAVQRTIQTKLRETINAADFGAVGDGVADDWAAIQAALDYAKTVKRAVILSATGNKYLVSRPLVLDDGQWLVGESRETTIIEKTSTLGPSPALGIEVVTRNAVNYNYDYDANAVVIFKKPEARSYPNGVGLHNITLQGKSGVTVTYGVYAPRLSRSRFSDVFISNVTNGWYTFDTFSCVFERVDIWNVSQGFLWANDGSNLGSGTSCTFIGCGVNFADVRGWFFYGLAYSTIIGSFAESIVSATPGNRPEAWFFQLCKGLTVLGCGSEVVKGYTFRISGGSVGIRGGNFSGLTGDTFSSNTAVVFLDSGAKVSIGGGARFEAVSSPGNIFNEFVTDSGSLLLYDETVTRPSGGAAASVGAGAVIQDSSASLTFSPTVEGTTSAGTATYGTREGFYTRVGNIVFYSLTVTWTGGTGSGNLQIGGLPFTSKNQTNFMQGTVQPGSTLTVSASKVVGAQVSPNTTKIRVVEIPVATGTVTLCAYDTDATISITGFYFV